MDDASFHSLTDKISRERGFACAHYKESCLRRRIAVRMRATGVHNFAGYAAVLDRDPAEYERLLDTLTINVTKFFRNPETYAAIATLVIPRLWEHAGPLTVWSAGCASGEEPYSLAMLFLQHAEALGAPADRVSVVATDIDPTILARAAAGRYEPRALDDAPPIVRERWFVPGTPAEVRPEVRARVRFERRDMLVEGPPATGLQLVTCRNVMIYFDRASQDRLLHTFHGALAPGGFLVLGKVESLLGFTRGLFDIVDAKERIYRRAA